MPLPAQCLPFIGAEQRREREQEKMRGGGGAKRKKIRDLFVLGDMRMPEKEGTIDLQHKYRRGVKMGRFGGTVGGGVFGLV